MPVDIGRVFSQSWDIIKQRFFVLLGMWIVFFVINIVYSIIGGGFMGGSMFAMGAAATGIDEPGALLGGLGIGFMLMMAVFYIGYIAIVFAQQCAMSALATPLRQTQFGDAIGIGFKAGVTFLAITVLFTILYLLFVVAYSIFALVLSLLGDAGAVISVLLLLPAMIYLALRFSVIVPVVAVDQVYNPITAIKRTWSMTGGKVLSILGVYLVIIASAIVLLGLPFFLMFGSIMLAESGAGDAAAMTALGSVIGGFLLLIPMFLIYSVLAIVISTCLHAQLTDTPADEVERTFG